MASVKIKKVRIKYINKCHARLQLACKHDKYCFQMYNLTKYLKTPGAGEGLKTKVVARHAMLGLRFTVQGKHGVDVVVTRRLSAQNFFLGR